MSRRVELFVSGCGLCDDAVALVRSLACPSCDIEVRNMGEAATLEAAKALGVRRVPAVVVDGVLLDCCHGGVEEATLSVAGIGTPVA